MSPRAQDTATSTNILFGTRPPYGITITTPTPPALAHHRMPQMSPCPAVTREIKALDTSSGGDQEVQRPTRGSVIIRRQQWTLPRIRACPSTRPVFIRRFRRILEAPVTSHPMGHHVPLPPPTRLTAIRTFPAEQALTVCPPQLPPGRLHSRRHLPNRDLLPSQSTT